MARDPVCGMEVDESAAEYKQEYMGRTYYFCSKGCLDEFLRNPRKYVHEHKSCCH